jgi:molybdenum cofactor cytidylyltransferase
MISAIVLAAGASRRMGRLKPLISMGGRTLLQAAIEPLRAAGVEEIVVVLGHRAGDIMPTLRGLGCRVVINRRYTRGMSSSIQRGLEAVNPRARAALMVLGDQPHIRPEVIGLLVEHFRRGDGNIVAPFYRGRRGHPVLFGRDQWNRLRALRGDAGARKLLARYPREVCRVEVDDPGILTDIDRPGDVDGGPYSGPA